MKATIISLVSLASAVVVPATAPLLSPVPAAVISQLSQPKQEVVLAEHTLDLATRHPDQKINDVFANNILLAVSFFDESGKIEVYRQESTIILKRIIVKFKIQPREVWAFHETVLPEFENRVLSKSGSKGLEVGDESIREGSLKTSGTKYTAKEGYQTALGLPGNGVCHLASLMNWAATEAGLEVTAKVNHNFAPIPGVPKEFGTSIRYTPDGSLNSANQNLYLKNNFDFPVMFVFGLKNDKLALKITAAPKLFDR